MGWSEDAARNRELSTKNDAEFTGEAVRKWLGRGFGTCPFEWTDGGVEFHLGHGEWIDLLRANGFEVERLVELEAPPSTGTHRFYDFVTTDWARRWPSEEIWVARKR